MIAQYNSKSLAYGIPGIILQLGGNIVARTSENLSTVGIGAAIALLGTVLLLIGLAFYAKAKGRSPVWCLMAFLSLIGLLVLTLLKDKAPDGQVASG
jgi:hypothetical protein